MTSVPEMGKESREHSFRLKYRSNGTWRNHQMNSSYIAKNAKKSCKTPVRTCVTAFQRFAKPSQRYPLMGTCYFRPYLSTNTFYKNIPQVFGKIPRKNGKRRKYNIITSKKKKKLRVNVSCQSQIVLGVKHQRAGNFKTIKKPSQDDPSVVAKK